MLWQIGMGLYGMEMVTDLQLLRVKFNKKPPLLQAGVDVTWLKSVLAYIGFPQAGFSSTDYFPLLPWIFLFATGYFLYSFLQEKGLINRLFGKGKVPGINFLGKHSLIIYMIHQPICYVVAFLVSEIFLPFKLMVAGQIACPNYHDIFRKELSV